MCIEHEFFSPYVQIYLREINSQQPKLQNFQQMPIPVRKGILKRCRSDQIVVV